MKTRPILFSGEMVRAILEGRKTQTRRVCKAPIWLDVMDMPSNCTRYGDVAVAMKCPYGETRDGMWVREAFFQKGHWEPVPGVKTKGGRQKWRFVPLGEIVFDEPKGESVIRKGRHHADPETVAWHKRLARFMPRRASRINLEIVAVRVERLHDIREADAVAEGCADSEMVDGVPMWRSAVQDYGALWDKINGLGAWDANPWVWVVEFERRAA